MRLENVNENSKLCCQCGCGLKPREDAANVLEKIAQVYFGVFGKKIFVTSGARCHKYNSSIAGAAANSAHTRGLAFDIAISSSSERYCVLNAVFSLNIKRIGINFEKEFVHFDIDDNLPQKVVFKYK